MKNFKSIIVFTCIVTMMTTSCMNSERKERYAAVEAYENYVDSIKRVSSAELSSNWDNIERTIEEKKKDAELQLNTTTDDQKSIEKYQNKIRSTTDKYNDFRQDVMPEINRFKEESNKRQLRNSLFQNDNITNDRNYEWVNRDNILSVYNHFVTTVIDNKESYTSENWEEIKLLYDGLNKRKEVVEDQGLTPADNRKIAALKLKFAPMYQFNKTETKIEENIENKR